MNNLLLIRSFVSEQLAAVEASLNQSPEDADSADWQYFKGMQDSLRDCHRQIDALIVRGA